MPIEEFFRGVPRSFPLLRWVATKNEQGYQSALELDRPREALGFRKAKIIVHVSKDGHEDEYKDDDWDDSLNAGLIDLGVKSRTPDEEKDRFALGLRTAFKTPERRYGDGYFNAVLVQYARKTDFHEHGEVATVLSHVNHEAPNGSRSYDDCWQMIDAAVKGRAAELEQDLKYEMPTAWDILSGALARYLDERFSVSNRRLLGLL